MANVRIILFQICFKETLNFVVGNYAGNIVVEVNMGGSGDDHQFLVAASKEAIGILAEIAAVGLLTVDEQNRILDFTRPGKQGLVQEALAADDVPAVVGVAAALVIAARGLIVGMIVLDEPGSIFRKRVDDAAGALICA